MKTVQVQRLKEVKKAVEDLKREQEEIIRSGAEFRPGEQVMVVWENEAERGVIQQAHFQYEHTEPSYRYNVLLVDPTFNRLKDIPVTVRPEQLKRGWNA